MEQENYEFAVEADDQDIAGNRAEALADLLREADGVIKSDRRKGDSDKDTMDLGMIVEVIAGSGATLAIAQGISAWLRGRRGTRLKIYQKSGTSSIKALVDHIDPESAVRITEEIVRNS